MRILLFVFTMGLLINTYGQNTKVMEDLELWTGAKYTKTAFGKKFSYSLESQIRFKKNMSNFNLIYIEPAIQYNLNKFIESGCELRIAYKVNRKEQTEQPFRYGFNFTLKQKLSKFSASYRIKYIGANKNLAEQDSTLSYESILRNKLLLKYNIKNNPLTPFISGELFNMLNAKNSDIYKLRISLGANYSLKKAGKIKVFYQIERELNNEHPYTYYIIGTRYNFKN